MFRIGRISDDALSEIAHNAASSQPTYAEIGATLEHRTPAGYHHDTYERILGDAARFDRAAHGLRTWVPHAAAGLRVQPSTPPMVGLTVALAAPVGPLSAIAICRVVAIVDEADRFGFAYGTLPGHPERGEEAFVVERRENEIVFRIVAFSRPAEPLARVGGPVTRRIQRRTTERYLEGLGAFVADG